MVLSIAGERSRGGVEARGYFVGFAIDEEDGGWWEVTFESPTPFIPARDGGRVGVLGRGIGGYYSATAERHDSRLRAGAFPNGIAELFGQPREVGEKREAEKARHESYGGHHRLRIRVSIVGEEVANLYMLEE